MDISPDELREAVESQHGGNAVFVQAVPVIETFQGQTVWEGMVSVFDLEGHPTAKRAYAWSHAVDDATVNERRRFFAVLHAGPIKSPADAVRAAIVAEHRAKEG